MGKSLFSCQYISILTTIIIKYNALPNHLLEYDIYVNSVSGAYTHTPSRRMFYDTFSSSWLINSPICTKRWNYLHSLNEVYYFGNMLLDLGMPVRQ